MAKVSFTTNVAGIRAFSPLSQRLPTGAYRARIVDLEESEGGEGRAGALIFHLKVDEGEHKGKKLTVRVTKDMAAGENGTFFGKQLQRGVLESMYNEKGIGIPVANLEAGEITISDELVVGKWAHVYVKQAPEGEKDAKTGKPAYDDRNFITKADYEMLTAVGTGTPAGATATGRVTAQPGANGMANLAAALGGSTAPAQKPALF